VVQHNHLIPTATTVQRAEALLLEVIYLFLAEVAVLEELGQVREVPQDQQVEVEVDG